MFTVGNYLCFSWGCSDCDSVPEPLSGFKAEHNQKYLFLGRFLMPFHGDKLAIKGTYNTDPSFFIHAKKDLPLAPYINYTV